MLNSGDSVEVITAQVSSRGQITIPAEVRRKLGLKPGSRVVIEVHGNTAVLRPMKSIGELSGILHEHARQGDRLEHEGH